jgi:hypothetical protein
MGNDMTHYKSSTTRRESSRLTYLVGAVIAGVITIGLAGCGSKGAKPTAAASAGSAATTKAPPANAASVGAHLISYQGDGFTVGLPGSPDKQQQTKQTAAGPVTVTILTVAQGQRAFALAYNAIPSNGTFDLDAAAKAAVGGEGGALTDLKTISFKGSEGRDYRITGVGGGQGTAFARILLVANRLFQLQAVVPGGNVQTAPPEYPAMLASLSF